ncbi:hypothetical protein PFICI_13187 [Pestalotiopsis fici W106-1]|uniref:L-ornithine N(5)-oxygenase n=1 Tax=Pestalotiopsis fici (strain W106-1 / CGMCC3.15140) TaxID=1229662 RepID=W3WLG2_PESFW|nr:uncharacterized protein PFICI_13187 [Pestalotiopsis fici W106-1]ETS74703.1 hypothetical protein PFICI_13187 [Pestalotiopsis fici W106-1]
MEEFHLVVVGAGWHGLAAAKVYHEVNPENSLLVLEAAATLGGVWAEDRLYPGLKTNNMLGTYEYPDFPMTTETFGVKPGEHIPGRVCHEYLTKYAEKFNIIDCIRYHTKVEVAEHQREGGWVLTLNTVTGDGKGAGVSKKIWAEKLVVATGLTSEPFLPHIEGQELYNAPLFHGRDLIHHVGSNIGPKKRATVFGGTKSGWDAVYAYATRGVEVDWVIRKSGHGPAWMAPPYVTPLKKWLEKLVNTRLLTWFSPCIWSAAGGFSGIRWFWHETAIGRAITNAFWSVLGNDVMTLNKYDSHPEMAKLKPWSLPMFTPSSFSIINYDTDFFELLRNDMVKVHIDDIVGLSNHAVHLSSGTTLESDALCCVTGWKHLPPMKFLPKGIEKDLGIPHAPSLPDELYDLVPKADEEILSRFPRLRDRPVQNKRYVSLLDNKGMSTSDEINPSTELTPYMLYRFMIPANQGLLRHRDIAFAGMVMNFSTTIQAHIQALWITAYFRDEVALFPDWTDAEAMDKMRYEAVLYSRFGRWRYSGGRSSQVPDFVFDALPHLDMLVADLGLQVHRKKGMMAEALEPYGPEDYANVVTEWMEKRRELMG